MAESVSVETMAPRIERLLEEDSLDSMSLRSLLEQLHPADIAKLLHELRPENAVVVFRLLAAPLAGEVLDEVDRELADLLFVRLPAEELAHILEGLAMDDAARLLAYLDPLQAGRLLDLMSPAAAADVRDRLAYPEETAGRLMNRDVLRLRRRWTVAEALEHLRRVDPETETVAYMYVTDRGERLIGVVPLRRLIVAPPEQWIDEITSKPVVAVSVWDDQEEVAGIVAKYDYYAVPVVDDRGRLAGVVTIDDIVHVLEEEATEDIQRIGGSLPLNRPYFSISILRMAWKRASWLLILFLGGTLTSMVIGYFEAELAQVLILGFFIPLLVGTGGNAGSQTVSTVIRALAVREVEWRHLLPVAGRELVTGLLVGSLLGLAGFGYVYLFWEAGVRMSLVVGLTLPLICTWATVVAAVVPIVVNKVGIDPTVISAPLITTVVDTFGLIIYFMIARALLGL